MAIVIATGVAEQDDDDGGGSEDDEAYDDVKLTRAAMTKVQNMMRELKGHQSAWLFMDPVDPAAVPGYAEAVAQPMDLSTVQVQLNNGAYSLLVGWLVGHHLLAPALRHPEERRVGVDEHPRLQRAQADDELHLCHGWCCHFPAGRPTL